MAELSGHVHVVSVLLDLSVAVPLACASTGAVDQPKPSFSPLWGDVDCAGAFIGSSLDLNICRGIEAGQFSMNPLRPGLIT